MKNKLLILLLSIFSCYYYSSAQNNYLSEYKRTNIIYNQLNKKSKSIVKKLISGEENANQLMNLADTYYQELSDYRQDVKNIEKQNKRYKLYKKMEKLEKAAIQYRINALDIFHSNAVRKYLLFKEDIQKFYQNTEDAKIDSSKKLEKLAHDAFENADVKVQIAYHTVNQGEQFDIYTHAYILEQIGLLYQHKIYALFLNWNMETQKHIDEEIRALLNNEPVNSFTQKEANQIFKDSVIYKEIMVHDTVRIKEHRPVVIYRVQIAASKEPISIHKIQEIYPSKELIHTFIEDGWYKYSVGAFATYREAQKFKNNIGVKDAFVIAYLNNKRVSITKALRFENQ